MHKLSSAWRSSVSNSRHIGGHVVQDDFRHAVLVQGADTGVGSPEFALTMRLADADADLLHENEEETCASRCLQSCMYQCYVEVDARAPMMRLDWFTVAP